ncbi:MAG: hypothetical protein EOO48_10565 [Flavobacterium sp.]|nr:MAG: hypothetical protein EOO48_10565 [Flavobacterium sp.]
MNYRLLYLFFAIALLASCTDDQQRKIEIARDQKKKESVFATVDKAWSFNTRPTNATSQSLSVSWNAWRVFLGELSQKPKSSIGAFRSKSRTLSLKAKDLKVNIPAQFNRPEIKSRIAVLQTKVNALNLFMNLNDIPAEKVTTLISDINTELAAVQLQMDEVVRRGMIPKEEGESDMIRMLDTARAIPNTPKPAGQPSGIQLPTGASPK